ncbi:MAG: arylesterase [Betaproteobacteria bacterium]
MLRRICLALHLLILGFLSLGQVPAHSATTPPVVLVVGDSISAGYGLPPGKGWVSLLADRLQTEGLGYSVVNASVSGDTTAGGRARLRTLLKQHQPAIVILELGGNDALRGGNLAGTRANLEAMVTAAQSARARVLIVGMQLPPNYGPAYVREFNALFGDVAKDKRAAIVPSIFSGFGDDLALFQPDRIHPSMQAQSKLLDNVWPALQPLLKK